MRVLRALLVKRVAVRLLIVALLIALAAPHAWAAWQYRKAEADLARFHPVEARRRLDTCLAVWPRIESVHLLASRASRGAGDFEDADARLRTAQKLHGGPSDELAFEWALLQATGGNVREVEPYLQHEADARPAESWLVWEALAEGYLRTYRILDAMSVLEHWLAGDKDNVRALELRGRTFITGKGVKRGSEDLRRVLELDPDRDDTRLRLTRALLDLGAYSEAVPHLERLRSRRPDDLEVPVRLARCLNMLNRREEARQTLEEVLAKDADNGLALRTLGQFAMSEGQPVAAEPYLRKAAAAMPNDYQANWLLYESLRQQGKPEAAAQLKLAEQARDRSERLGELQSRRLAEQPLDPALHVELATLLLRSGQTELALSWLNSALALDSKFKPAHAALVELYTKRGQPDLAEEHRRLANE
jgi:tetratricopeptide (TPR) repeat protein